MLTFTSVLAAALLAPALLFLWNQRGWSYRSAWPASIVVLVYGYMHFRTAYANIVMPREWDFACFWLYGHVAAAGFNVYDPTVYHAIPKPFRYDVNFAQEVLNVGFPYPPPTIFMFLPLGHMSGLGGPGISLWYAAQFAALVAAAVVLQRALLPGDGPRAAVLVFALTLLLPALDVDTHFAQTSSFCLLFVALAFAGRSSTWGAAWPILALLVKPYAGSLLLVDVVHWRWRRLATASATAALGMLAAGMILGPKTIMSYIVSGPVGREPAYVYGGTASIFGVLARTAAGGHMAAGAVRPLYFLLAAVLLAATLYLCARAPRIDPLAFCLALLGGLLIYPATQEAYGVVHVVPLLVLWTMRERLPWRAVGAAAVLALTILLERHLQFGFPPNAFLWACCAYVMFRERHGRIITEKTVFRSRVATAK